jgi:hypothetical protein
VHNVVHQAILELRELLPPSVRSEVIGVEWWAHKRPFSLSNNPERNSLSRWGGLWPHFDVDDVHRGATGETHHPLYSSVLHLSQGTQPTLFINETSGFGGRDKRVTSEGLLVSPGIGHFMLFKGDLFHTVLPSKSRDPEKRITITFAWWHRKCAHSEMECADDAAGKAPELSQWWQQEFPPVSSSSGMHNSGRHTSDVGVVHVPQVWSADTALTG